MFGLINKMLNISFLDVYQTLMQQKTCMAGAIWYQSYVTGHLKLLSCLHMVTALLGVRRGPFFGCLVDPLQQIFGLTDVIGYFCYVNDH